MPSLRVQMQRDGFASDSVRMVREVKKGRTEASKVQILLFSATFADDIKAFAQSVIGERANEVSPWVAYLASECDNTQYFVIPFVCRC